MVRGLTVDLKNNGSTFQERLPRLIATSWAKEFDEVEMHSINTKATKCLLLYHFLRDFIVGSKLYFNRTEKIALADIEADTLEKNECAYSSRHKFESACLVALIVLTLYSTAGEMVVCTLVENLRPWYLFSNPSKSKSIPKRKKEEKREKEKGRQQSIIYKIRLN